MRGAAMRGRGALAAVPVVLLSVLLAAVWPAGAGAQQAQPIRSPILALDQERLFSGSAFGHRVEAELQADVALLEAENRRIEAELEAEERDLTNRRPAMTPEAFRALADAFDTRVQRIRSEQGAKARALGQRSEAAQRAFLVTARPVLEQLMVDSGAVVIVDRRSVLMSLSVIDVTEDAIRRINAIIGDGSGLDGEAPAPPDDDDAPALPDDDAED